MRSHYRGLLDRFLLPAFCDKSLSRVSAAGVRRLCATTATSTLMLHGHTYALLPTILGTAVSDEPLTVNPCHIPGAGRRRSAHRIEPATVSAARSGRRPSR